MDNIVRFIKRRKHFSAFLLVGAVYIVSKLIGLMIEDAFIGYLNQKVAGKWKEVYPLCKQYIPIITQWIFPALVAALLAYIFSKYVEVEKELTLKKKTLFRLSELYEKGVQIMIEGHTPKSPEEIDLWHDEIYSWKVTVMTQIDLLSSVDANMFFTLGNNIKPIVVNESLDAKQKHYLAIINEHISRLRDYINQENQRIKTMAN